MSKNKSTNKPVAPSPGVRIMVVLYVDTLNSTPDSVHNSMLEAGFNTDRNIFASYPTGNNDMASDEGMYLMQEVLAKQ